MSYEPQSSSSSNTVLIIVLVLLGAFVLVGAICGGAIYFFAVTARDMAQSMQEMMVQQQRDQADAERAARSFLDGVRANRLEEAYRSTTPEFQKRYSLEEWNKLVARHPALTKAEAGPRVTLTLVDPFEMDEELVFMAEIDGPAGQKLEVKITVRKAGEAWKVERIELDERSSPAKPGP